MAAISNVSTRYVIRVNVVAASVPFGIASDGCFKSPKSQGTWGTLMTILYTTRCAVTTTSTNQTSQHTWCTLAMAVPVSSVRAAYSDKKTLSTDLLYNLSTSWILMALAAQYITYLVISRILHIQQLTKVHFTQKRQFPSVFNWPIFGANPGEVRPAPQVSFCEVFGAGLFTVETSFMSPYHRHQIILI